MTAEPITFYEHRDGEFTRVTADKFPDDIAVSCDLIGMSPPDSYRGVFIGFVESGLFVIQVENGLAQYRVTGVKDGNLIMRRTSGGLTEPEE